MNDFFDIREENGLRLIVPSHGAAVGNAAWNPSNLWWRSRVETTEGDLVSQGFGKFFNLGQGPLDLQVTVEDIAKACERDDAIATLKIDGSLLIRSVHYGQAYFRTRGSFRYEHLENGFEVEEFCKRYPMLLDPTFAPNHSLLFEWVSPNNCIVIKYPEADITLVGAVDHASMKYERLSVLDSMSECLALKNRMMAFHLNSAGWASLQASLIDDLEREGFVIRINGQQTLVKVKCPHYLAKHALKSHLTSEKLADLYFQYGRPNFSGFLEKFSEAFDEETAMWAMPAISSLYDGVRELERIERHIEVKVIERQTWTRKDFAIATLAEYGQTKKFAYAMNRYLGNPKNDHLLKSILLQNTKQTEMSFLKGMGEESDDTVAP